MVPRFAWSRHRANFHEGCLSARLSGRLKPRTHAEAHRTMDHYRLSGPAPWDQALRLMRCRLPLNLVPSIIQFFVRHFGSRATLLGVCPLVGLGLFFGPGG